MPPKKSPLIEPSAEPTAAPPEHSDGAVTSAVATGELRELTTAIRFKYGSVEVEFSISQTVVVATVAQQHDMFDRQVQQLNYEHDQFAERSLPKMRRRDYGSSVNGNKKQSE